MLPSLLVQLFVETFPPLLHAMLFLGFGVSNVIYTLIAAVICMAYIGKTLLN
jgi:hypothetical protein